MLLAFSDDNNIEGLEDETVGDKLNGQRQEILGEQEHVRQSLRLQCSK